VLRRGHRCHGLGVGDLGSFHAGSGVKHLLNSPHAASAISRCMVCGRCVLRVAGAGIRSISLPAVRNAGARSGSQQEPETAVLPVTIPPLAR
jgi:hypothetical protein